jgi:hypothetical protein
LRFPLFRPHGGASLISKENNNEQEATMPYDLDSLRRQFTEGRIGRRDFLAGATALGLSAVAAQSLLPGTARAAAKKGGRFRCGLAEGGTTDSLDPQTYTDIYMISAGFAPCARSAASSVVAPQV